MANETVPSTPVSPSIPGLPPGTPRRRDQPDLQVAEEKATLALITMVNKLPTSGKQVTALNALVRTKDLISDVIDENIEEDRLQKQAASQAAMQANVKPAPPRVVLPDQAPSKK